MSVMDPAPLEALALLLGEDPMGSRGDRGTPLDVGIG